MVDAKLAVANAQRYLHEMYGGNISDILLEEVEQSSAGNMWRITLSFIRPGSPVTGTGMIAEMLGSKYPRHYKVFELNSETGEVESMRIRQDARTA